MLFGEIAFVIVLLVLASRLVVRHFFNEKLYFMERLAKLSTLDTPKHYENVN